jgi:uncharacterized protein YkwD
MIVEMESEQMIRRLFLLLSFSIFLYALWGVWQKQPESFQSGEVTEVIQGQFKSIMQNEKLNDSITNLLVTFDQMARQLSDTLLQNEDLKNNTEPVEKPVLATPTEQIFSIHNIQLNQTKEEVEHILGPPQRSSINEYGVNWTTYHQNYHNFIMVGYDSQSRVAAIYTNQDLISSSKGIVLGSSKQLVGEQLGESLSSINKGMVFYQFDKKKEFEMFLIEDSYITIFYDQHQNNSVTAIQVISKSLEESRHDYYTKETESLKEGFEYQLFDLTNAARVKFDLPTLSWDDYVKETARKHSKDMAVNNYFSHDNLEGQSPFDRMLEDEIQFTMAGENLAYGQYSSIFAHEGLMNSLGHRENILQKDFEYLGVGVAFNSKSQPYYTQNFYSQ